MKDPGREVETGRSLDDADPATTSTDSLGAALDRGVTPAGPVPVFPARYEIREVLGVGGMAVVHRAFDRTMRREVAVKCLDPIAIRRPDLRVRILNEARAAARLRHPNILEVFDVDAQAGYIVMELVDGRSLRDVLRDGPIPASRARAIVGDVFAALAAAHAAGIVHRDIKPANVMIQRDDRVVVVDFGVAHVIDTQLTITGERLGTPAYMSPEQLRGGTVDGRSDLYSVGVMLFEMLVGRRPKSLGTITRQELQELQTACADAGLVAVVEQCMQLDPGRRVASATAAWSALAGAPRRRRRRMGVLALVAALLATTALLVVTRREPAGEDRRLAEAWRRAQRGELEPARVLVLDYLQERPTDGSALTLAALVAWWLGRAETQDRAIAAQAAVLSPGQRALVTAVPFLHEGRFAEARAFLREREREYPGDALILYALGESLWHDADLEGGAAELENAFLADPTFQMALHHVVDLRLASGQWARLAHILERLRSVDSAAATALEAEILLAQRSYEAALVLVEQALARHPKDATLVLVLAQTRALRGDYEGSRRAAARALELWPLDAREWGPATHYAELHLYEGDLDAYARAMGARASFQVALVNALWRGKAEPPASTVSRVGLRSPPHWTATAIEQLMLNRAADAADPVWRNHPDLEVRHLGEGLDAEQRGDLVVAERSYSEGLEARSSGEVDLLLAHHLARVRHGRGDRAGAASACALVLHPRVYLPYRAAVLPDCLWWTAEATQDLTRLEQLRRLVQAWRGPFVHPAIARASEILDVNQPD